MPNDPKWRVISRHSKRPVSEVVSVFVYMLTAASEWEHRGSLGNWNDEDVGAALDIETEHVEAIRLAMQGRVLDGDELLGWSKRQPAREDSSAERTKAWRERKKQDVTHGDAQKRDVTHCDAPEEKRIDKNIDITSTSKDPDGCAVVSPSKRFDDQLLRTTAEAWNELATSLGLATVAKLTDARKVAITRRAKELVEDFDFENPAAGFSEFFAKIRGSPFLRGSESSWRCDFDWCFALSNFTKIMEGKYENRPQKVVSFRR